MKEMGLKLPFEAGELTEMIYCISLYIKVNEEGTEAAASTAVRGSKGQTLQQLLYFLGSTSVGDLNLLSSKVINLASPAENVAGSYNAELKSVEFVTKAEEVVKQVNSWAEAATKRLIKDLLPTGSLKSDTALVLPNALYFKGAWDQKFDPSSTQLRDFHLLNGQTLQVPFMTTNRYMRHLYGLFDGYKDLPAFWIPKFKFSFELEASKSMKEMGLKLPFEARELTEMVDGPNSDRLYVSDTFHKSHIEVNEEGTETAASTAAAFRFVCATFPTPSFVADHPFMFMIREEIHGMVFFVGAVLNPLLDV
ncbi:hypothetical protein FEM48_Zijuj04G0063400 [Ziziphus jujuba var. spinosa]|uniref:Serpin domain-containing protein n=1 Tax=Ziziphus jujuba var. spinosa TaxID=714518 RepID=A0A978VIA5_ZIZJJ|nr:hypothetical protein FEM48_Zijuj04G0063400 [Ziziphus jujuba var. spinosa]